MLKSKKINKSKSKANKNVKNIKTKKVNKTKKPCKVIQRGGALKAIQWINNRDDSDYYIAYEDSNPSNFFYIYDITEFTEQDFERAPQDSLSLGQFLRPFQVLKKEYIKKVLDDFFLYLEYNEQLQQDHPTLLSKKPYIYRNFGFPYIEESHPPATPQSNLNRRDKFAEFAELAATALAGSEKAFKRVDAASVSAARPLQKDPALNLLSGNVEETAVKFSELGI